MSVITASNVKTFGDIDYSDKDDLIADVLIPGAEGWMERELDCKLSTTSVSGEKDSAWGYYIWPLYKPITALVQATGVYDRWGEEYIDDVLYTPSYIYRDDEETFSNGDKRYSLTYTAGYTSSTCPANIKLALMMLVCRALGNPQQKSRQAANGYGYNWAELAKTDIIDLIAEESFKTPVD